MCRPVEFRANSAVQRARMISIPRDSLDAKSVPSGRTSIQKTLTRKTSSTVAARSKRLSIMVEEVIAGLDPQIQMAARMKFLTVQER